MYNLDQGKIKSTPGPLLITKTFRYSPASVMVTAHNRRIDPVTMLNMRKDSIALDNLYTGTRCYFYGS